MKKILVLTLFLLLFSISISAKEKLWGYAEKGGLVIQTAPATNYNSMETYPGCTVTVYLTGTTTLATIYSDDAGTVKSNPFTADSAAYYEFYVADGVYDIKFSGTGITVPFTKTRRAFTLDSIPLNNIIDVVKIGGVKNDGVVLNDGFTISGSTLFNSTSKACSITTDVGKELIAAAAGSLSTLSGLNNALRTTIVGCSGSSFVMQTAASATTNNTKFVYVSISTIAMQALVTSKGNSGTFYFPDGIYGLGSVTLNSNQNIFAFKDSATIYSTSSSVFVTSGKSNITINGITIDAGGNPLPNGAVTLVGGTTMTDFTVMNSTFKDDFLTNNVSPVGTFNRHGVLCRDYTNFKVLNCKFLNGLRIKGAGSGNSYNAEIAFSYFKTVNENGVSFLANGATDEQWNILIHDNIFDGIMSTGNAMVFGDDGSGVTQKIINFTIARNLFRGSLPANTSFIQNRGSFYQNQITYEDNSFYNEGTNQSNTMAINNAPQTASGTSIINFKADGNKAYGKYDYADYRFSSIASGIISNNQGERDDGIGNGLRVGTLSNTLMISNRFKNFGIGIYFNDGLITNAILKDNLIQMPALNNVAGIYIDSMSTVTELTIENNRIKGSNTSTTNTYGIRDASNGNGNTDNIKYINNDIVNIITTSGLGSAIYRTLPAHALVINAPSAVTPTLTVNSATPSVVGLTSAIVNNSSATVITDLPNGYNGQILPLTFANGNTTFQSNSNIKLSGGVNFVGTTDDVLTLRFNGTVWQQVSSSVN